jgi:hypothetical protein
MHTNERDSERITIDIDRRTWRGLKFEADLLSKVFGNEVTPERLVETAVERALKSRLGATK